MHHIPERIGGGYALPKEGGLTDVWFPATGGRYTFKAAADQTDGRLAQVLCREPRGAAAPLHLHHDADETWYVLDGRLTLLVGDESFEAGPGDFVLGPRGVPHSFVVSSDAAEFLATFTPAGAAGPAGAGLEGFCREIGIPVVAGEQPPAPVAPDLAEFARRAARYAIEIVGPPPTLD